MLDHRCPGIGTAGAPEPRDPRDDELPEPPPTVEEPPLAAAAGAAAPPPLTKVTAFEIDCAAVSGLTEIPPPMYDAIPGMNAITSTHMNKKTTS